MRRPLQVLCLACLLMGLTARASSAQISDQELARIRQAIPDRPVVLPSQPRRLLVFDRCDGFRHSSIPYWDKTLELMGQKTGAFEVTISSDTSVFSPEVLSQFDAICLNNTTRLTFTEPQRRALLDFVRSGKGLAGIHAATDNFYGWDEASGMIGARFVKHPWTSDKTVTVKIDDPCHPLTRHWGGNGFKVNDEIYVTHPPFYSHGWQRVLLSLDMTDDQTRNVQNVTQQDLDTGISWVKSYGKGRVFYCSLGHNHHICWDPKILQHYLAGIQFALGDLQVQTQPIPHPQDLRVAGIKELIQKASSYGFDQAPDQIYALDQAIRGIDEDPAYRLAAEQLLLEALESGGSLAWKDFVCRQLSMVGSARSIGPLLGMLKDQQTADMAVYALGRIGGPEVCSAMVQALPEAPPSTQVAMITALGHWPDDQVVTAIGQMLDRPDTTVRSAAISALGMIGTEQAAGILMDAFQKVGPQLRDWLLDAALVAADHMVAQGKAGQAAQVYKKVYGSDCDVRFRASALAGWARADKEASGRLILSAMDQADQGLVVAACGMLDLIADHAGRAQALGRIGRVPVEGRLAMLSSVARAQDRGLVQAVLSVAKTESGQVQLAAIRTLGDIGDGTCIGFLAQAAAGGSGQVRAAARDALTSLQGQDIDDRLILGLESGGPDVQCELIRALAGRSATKAVPVLLNLARSGDQQVSSEAARALGIVAGAQDLPAIARLLWDQPSQGLEDAIVWACLRTDSAVAGTEALLAVYDRAGPSQAKGSVLRVLGRLGADKGLAVLLEGVGSVNQEIRTESVRALSQWPTPQPMGQLWKIAADQGRDLTERVLALRGYVNMVPMQEAVSPPEKVRMLQNAMSVASRVEDRRLILGVLAQCACLEALEMAEAALQQPSLRGEAESAIIRLADSLVGQYPDRVKAVLEKIRSGTLERSQVRTIDQILRRARR